MFYQKEEKKSSERSLNPHSLSFLCGPHFSLDSAAKDLGSWHFKKPVRPSSLLGPWRISQSSLCETLAVRTSCKMNEGGNWEELAVSPMDAEHS